MDINFSAFAWAKSKAGSLETDTSFNVNSESFRRYLNLDKNQVHVFAIEINTIHS